MIKKILVANRGEIALRVFKTCKKMGIDTVSIYAQNDSTLVHASAGDTNINLGGGNLSDTYLNQEKIIKIAKDNNVDAIHPGYGFLSENTDFCKKVNAAGIIFIGPGVEAIELMGDKKTSKVAMGELGIPLVPGYHGDDQSEKVLATEAKKIGFPVLIKATAGGGGKGMRIVENEKDFSESLASAKREALNAFSNDKVLLEKYIINPRHIEVQLVSDGAGNHFHFFERECSIQRRYQKVIEEAPASCLTEELRQELCNTAVKISSGINYCGAGTIEYIFAPDNTFYFLEMNTRLQVEHPVTEMTTGFDLVELQIKAANGEAFNFTQKDIKQSGNSIECRIYAENPDHEFFPTTGKILKIETASLEHYRLDCGYRDGNSITTSYDPMLAKLTVHGPNREVAIKNMLASLDSVVFGGVKTNRDYLKRILNHKNFLSGDIHTHFIKDFAGELAKTSLDTAILLDIAAGIIIDETLKAQNVWTRTKAEYELKITIDGSDYLFSVTGVVGGLLALSLEGSTQTYPWSEKSLNKLGFKSYLFDKSGLIQVFCKGSESLVFKHEKAARFSGEVILTAGSLQSPMPGKIFKILKEIGSNVTAGETVMIVEAMKMEHAIKASKDGTVSEIFYKEGAQVQGGVSLCEIS